MRASGGRSHMPPKRTTTSPSRSTREGGEAQGGGGGNSQQAEPILVVSEKQDGNPREERGFGSNEKSEIQLEGHQFSPMKLGDIKTSLERGIRKNAGNIIEVRNSNFNANHVPLYTNHVQDFKTIGLTDSKTKPKWTCVARMDCGLVQINKECPISKLGKRGINHVVEPKGEHEVMVKTAKQRRVADTEDVHDDELARVENRLCRMQ